MAAALTLSPPLLEFGIEPGREIISKVKVFNESAETISLYTSTANFTTQDEAGTPFFLLDEEGGLASWIEITPGPIVLLSGERQEVAFVIKVPEDADPGGHYAGIFFGSAPPESGKDNGQVSVVSKLGSILLVKVSGDVTIKNTIQEFHILNDQKFFTRLPIKFWYRLRNGGDLHVRPEGTIEIKNILGLLATKEPITNSTAGICTTGCEEKVIYNYVNANPVGGAVLPGSIRKFETTWKKNDPYNFEYRNFFQGFIGQAIAEYKNFAFGRYTAALKLNNVPESAAVGKIVFWVLPWHLLLVILLFVVVVFWILFIAISRYNRWIVKKAMQSDQKTYRQSTQIEQEPSIDDKEKNE